MKHALLVSLMLMVCAGSAQAQLYKSVGPNGKVTYSDTPPATAAKVEVKPIGGGAGGQGFPFDVAEAVRTSPIVMFSSAGCPSCEEGRKLLIARGIPFTEKNVLTKEDLDVLKRAGGDKVLPYMTVGRIKQEGFEENTWNRLLTTAGYPEVNKLPKTYRQPPAESAAPSVKVTQEKESKTSRAETAPSSNNGAPPDPIGNVPPGFRF